MGNCELCISTSLCYFKLNEFKIQLLNNRSGTSSANSNSHKWPGATLHGTSIITESPWPAHGKGCSAPCFWIWYLGKVEQETEETEMSGMKLTCHFLLDLSLTHGPRHSTVPEAQSPQLYNYNMPQKVAASVREQNSARHLAQTRMHRCSGPCFSWGTDAEEPGTQSSAAATWCPPSKEQPLPNVKSCHRWALSHVLGSS